MTGIVVVTYESASEVGACLDAALRLTREIVVVDNASRDHTREEVARRGVRLIANPRNLGFAAAANQGIRALSTPFIVLLNPDAVIQAGIEALERACELPHTAGAGGKLLGADGRPQVGFMVRRLPTATALSFEALLVNRLWRSNPVNWKYRCLGMNVNLPQPVEQPAGAFLMVRRDAWEALGGFDEGFYPLWFEDVDFCKRARDRGWELRYVPEAVAKHTGGHSLNNLQVEQRPLYWYRSLLGYAARHFRPWQRRGVCAAVLAGALLRLPAMLWKASPEEAAVYGKVARLAVRVFFGGRDVLQFPDVAARV
ncbi:MAG: glycosyltransferase family 2 protein [Bryobacteraceae bacterium]